MLSFLTKVISYGVKESDDFYDVRLKRAVNVLSFNAIFCITIAFFIGVGSSEDYSAFFLLPAIPFYLGVVFLNKFDKSHIGITIMFAIGAALVIIFSLRSGEESNTHSLFLLNIIGSAILYRKGKYRIYYFVNLIMTVLSFVFVIIAFKLNWFADLQAKNLDYASERTVNLFFLIAVSILFSVVVVNSFSSQFKKLRKSIHEKEILLAEINHRVKNNLSIIVSLLRLKQNLSQQQETKDALRDIGNRIHSMALVHRKMYEGEGLSFVHVPGYIDDLMDGICESVGGYENMSCSRNIDDVSLEVSDAIPLGMILNELIMNSLKHAFDGIDKPKISIDYHKTDDGYFSLVYQDNGVGMDESDANLGESLGLELIHSLTEQLDGNCEYKDTDNGLEFEMRFPIKNSLKK